MMAQIGPYLGGMAAVIVAVFGGVKVFRDSNGTKLTASNEFTKNLMERLDKVEKRVELVETQLATEREVNILALSYIERLAWTWPRTAWQSFPQPPRLLRDRLDSASWGRDPVEQIHDTSDIHPAV